MFQKRLKMLYRLVDRHFSIRTTGLEKIDPDRNYIFAMNHQSVMDIPIAYTVLAPQTNRQINLFLSHYFYFIFFPLTLPLDAISINMNKGRSPRIIRFNRSQLEKGIAKLKRGNNVLIYPEGGMDGALSSQVARGETGAVRLAVRTGIPLLPIGIRGTNHAYPFTVSSSNPLRHDFTIPIEITIGDPISYQEYSHLDLEQFSLLNQAALRSLTEELMARLSHLSGLGRMPAS